MKPLYFFNQLMTNMQLDNRKSLYENFKQNRILSFVYVLGIYLIALGFALGVFIPLQDMDLRISFFIVDVVATIVVWFGGLIVGNASVYDPYWSVVPPVLLLWALLLYCNWSFGNIILLVLVILWSIRLTINWGISFRSLMCQDWRYTLIQRFSPKFWYLSSFVCIDFIPTLIVFVNLQPIFDYFKYSSNDTFSYFVIPFYVVILLSIILQGVADCQLRKFHLNSDNVKKICNVGLWKYSRHPNYFCELSFWWSFYFINILNSTQHWHYLLVGPVLMSCLFIFISIPMMEKRQLRKNVNEYREYQETTSMLFFMPNLPSLPSFNSAIDLLLDEEEKQQQEERNSKLTA